MKKCLNVKMPSLTGYLEEAHPLSVVEYYDMAKEWLYSNYITLVYGEPLNNSGQPLKFFKLTIDGIGWCYKLPTSFSVFYKSEHFLHALFLYGYDTEKNIFYIMAYHKKTML